MTGQEPESATPQPRAASLSVQRRLSPLEAGAATAVIVSCLVALAMMTGVLDPPSRLLGPEAALTGTASQLVAERPVLRERIQGVSENSLAMVGTAPALAPLLPEVTTPPATGVTEQIVPVENLPILPAVPMVTESTPPQATAGASAASLGSNDKSHARRTRVRKNRQDQNFTSKRLAASRKTHGKTRQQVTAELMRAQRDGSYRATSETYR